MDPEKRDASHAESVANSADHDDAIRRDPQGLPVIPQPSSHQDDPLNWHPARKLIVAIQVSWLALLTLLASAAPNPSFVLMSKTFGLSVKEISYELTVFLIFAGVGPLAIVPFANAYGRRPVYLVGTLITAVTSIAAGFCDTWAGIMVTRVFSGLAAGWVTSMGAATICDMYFVHQRGVYLGIYTLSMTSGPHVAPLVGGFVAQSLGWRACFYIPGYLQIGTFVVILFCLPETRYSAKHSSAPNRYVEQSYIQNITFRNRKVPGGRPCRMDFARPFRMLKLFAVVVPAISYMTCFAYGTVLFALTGAHFFTDIYGFTTAQTGLMLSIPLLIGGVIGEFSAGWVTDWLSNRYARTHNGERLPEARLTAIWGALLVPVGVIIEGVCLSHSDTVPWIGSAFGMGIANVGLQIATTTIYAYTTDCYKAQSAEISTVLNVFRQICSFPLSFYAIPFTERVEIQYAWLTFAMAVLVTWIPVLLLKYYGSRLRSMPSQKIVPVHPSNSN
ncbi:major facilitator superfamily domain-containing protein [Aspergillus lucknowensis]|uniref:Major facilitator superfamily domain-containing protein n=1 Tax=Aspergillus lucknowensis TaxID=176173 RepID=A0ABR4LTH1_9EURO